MALALCNCIFPSLPPSPPLSPLQLLYSSLFMSNIVVVHFRMWLRLFSPSNGPVAFVRQSYQSINQSVSLGVEVVHIVAEICLWGEKKERKQQRNKDRERKRQKERGGGGQWYEEPTWVSGSKDLLVVRKILSVCVVLTNCLVDCFSFVLFCFVFWSLLFVCSFVCLCFRYLGLGWVMYVSSSHWAL